MILFFPDVEQMQALVLRDNLDDKTDKVVLALFETLFDAYWHLLAKVAVNSSWNNHKRLLFLSLPMVLVMENWVQLFLYW